MNKNAKVNSYMDSLENPHKGLWEDIREIILNVDPRVSEDIKWGAPTFVYEGNMATFNPRAKKFVNLTFHTGATIKDPEGVLTGDAKEARVFRVESRAELAQKKAGLELVVKNWILSKDS